MSVEIFAEGQEPQDLEAVIWRFMDFEKFRDLMTTGELYFCRADRFKDKSEGLPPEEYLHVLNLNPNDVQGLNHAVGSIAQFREAFFITCWYLFTEETTQMWKEYGKDGVAICSRYSLLKSALDAFVGQAHLGLVRYGSKHLTCWNIIQFIFTKQEQYKHEHEVRALVWLPDEYAGINRHFDENNNAYPRPLTPPPGRVPEFQRRKVDLQSLITEIVINPFESDSLRSDVERLTRESGRSIQVRPSELTQYSDLLP